MFSPTFPGYPPPGYAAEPCSVILPAPPLRLLRFRVFSVLRAETVPPVRTKAALRPRFLGSAQGIPLDYRNGSHSEGLVGSS